MQEDMTKSRSPTAGTISFVSFDANPSLETKKAVRKQAALASAAARKATIARKIAQLKEQDGEEDKPKEKQKRKRSDSVQPRRGPVKKEPQESSPVTSERSAGDTSSPQDEVKAEQYGEHTFQVVRKEGTPVSYHPADETGRPLELDWLAPASSKGIKSPASSRKSTPSSSASRPRITVDQDEQVETVGACACEDCKKTGVIGTHRPEWLVSPICKNADGLPMSPNSLPGPFSIGDGKMDPFNRYPVEYFPIFDKLLHHMLTIFAPRGWPTLKITRDEGLSWESWMTEQALKEPAFFYVRVLWASGDMIRLNQLDPKIADWLRALAINAINEALCHPTRSTSDGLILAVGRIALTESMYGDRDAATRIHRPAQKRMIDLRGGMNALDFPPLVKKLMRWADSVMAIQSGTERILGDANEAETDYGAKKSVDVLEKWVPQEGKALRKKIAISDLVT